MATLVNDRIDVRISKEQKELIKFASELSGFKSLSEFVVYHVGKRAKEIVKEHNTILKSNRDKEIFLNAILNPPAPNAELKEAQLHYNKLRANGFDYDSFKKGTYKK